MSKRISGARFVFLVISAGGAFIATAVFTITPLYRIESAGLNPLELVLVGTFMEAAVFVFEIPTGIVADVYSRRLSVIIGNIGMGIGFVMEGAYPHVGTIMAAQILWGITYTFTSGATEAWLAGEIGEDALDADVPARAAARADRRAGQRSSPRSASRTSTCGCRSSPAACCRSRSASG